MCWFDVSGDADNPLEVHDPAALWSGALDVGRKASIQRGRDLEANRTEVGRRELLGWTGRELELEGGGVLNI